jgi:c(7)-type cytochrome triheme protein
MVRLTSNPNPKKKEETTMKKWLVFTAMLLVAGVPALATVGGGDITLPVKDAGNVVFSHDRHVAEAGLKCQECHAKLYLDAKQHVKVTMAEMEKGKSCGACHDGKVAFSVKGDCNKCHAK